MYNSQPQTSRSGVVGLPSLRQQRRFEDTSPSSSVLHNGTIGTDGNDRGGRKTSPFGKAWSPPASLNGTQLQRPVGVSTARQFTFSSSPPTTPEQLYDAQPAGQVLFSSPPQRPAGVRPGGAAHSVSPVRAPYSARLATSRECSMPAASQDAPRDCKRNLFISHAPESGNEADQAIDVGVAAPPSSAQPQMHADSTSHARSNANASKSERIAEIDRFLVKNSASYIAEPQRNSNVRRAAEDVARVYPALSSIVLQINRYVKEIGDALQNAQATHAGVLAAKERELHAKFERFFEEKLCAVLRDKKTLERTMEQLHQENYRLRQERDEELTDVKVDLMKRLNVCEKREDEYRSFRQLIAAVFKTNEQLSGRVGTLETILAQHHIDVPPATDDIFRYSQSAAGAGGVSSTGGNADETQNRQRDEAMAKVSGLPPAFMQASKEELNLSRLTLQQELLHCAFDDRSAYRLQISGLKNENNNLKYELSIMRSTVESLNRYIHEKRFLSTVYDDDGNATVPMTPRPRDVPFAVETELGVDLKGSTGAIVSELSAVATSLKQQLNSALLRLRQATTVSEWMSEDSLVELDVERNGDVGGVLPTFPVNAWPTIPHFLRTIVSPDVDNLRWSQSDIAAVLLTFFQKYTHLRESCRFIRDSKMVAPRTYQQFERSEVVLTRLDASKEEVENSAEAVPFGYVVTQFVRSVLMELAPSSKEANLVLPGTAHPRFVIRKEEKVVELEFTRFAYNMWWAAQRYRDTQPLCRLFLEVVNGRLAVGVFDMTEKVLARVVRFVQSKLDLDGSHTFTYQRLVGGVARLVADMDAHATRCGVLAVAQTFESNQVPIMGGRVRLDALIADESHCLHETTPGNGALTGINSSDASRGAGKSTSTHASSNLPPTITARRVPAWRLQPLGASVFVRFWRRLALERYERVYAFVERALAPLVVESDVVLGLYLLPIPEALERAGCFDGNADAKAADYAAATPFFFPNDSALKPPPSRASSAKSTSGGSADEASRANDNTTASMEAYDRASHGVPDVTKSYAALLQNSRQIITRRKEAEKLILTTLVKDVLKDIPRLNRSVHFPFADKTVEVLENDKEDRNHAFGGPGSDAESRSAAGNDSKKGKAKKGEKGLKKDTKSAKGTRKQQGAPKNAALMKTAQPNGLAPSESESTTAKSEPRGGHGAHERPRNVGKKQLTEAEAIPTDMVTVADRELAEWYGFCFALRQRAPLFAEQIFTDQFLDSTWEGKAEGSTGRVVEASDDNAGAPSGGEEEKPFADAYEETASGESNEVEVPSGTPLAVV